MEEVVPDLLWTDFDPVRMIGLPVGRRAAVARGANGQLVVFSPIKATAGALAALKGLKGDIAAFVVPNRLHDSFFDDYFSHFPNARFLAGAQSVVDHRKWPLTVLATDLPELSGFHYHLIGGMPRTQEHAFFHPATRTLIVADLMFNIPQAGGLFSRMLMSMADMGGRPRPSRFWRSLIKSPELFGQSLKTILEWDFDRIVPGHGHVIETDGRRVFEKAFERWLR